MTAKQSKIMDAPNAETELSDLTNLEDNYIEIYNQMAVPIEGLDTHEVDIEYWTKQNGLNFGDIKGKQILEKKIAYGKMLTKNY